MAQLLQTRDLLRSTCLLDGLEDKEQEIEEVTIKAMLFIKGCKQCKLTLNKRCTKLIIENCTNLVININQQILTNMIEIINSKNITIHLSVPCSTITVDNSEHVTLDFASETFFKMVVSANVTDLVLTSRQHRFVVTHDEDNDMTEAQYITRWVMGQILTEKVLRTVEGFVTTSREQKLAQENAQENAVKFEKFLRSIIKFEKREKAGGDEEEKGTEKEKQQEQGKEQEKEETEKGTEKEKQQEKGNEQEKDKS